MPTVLTPGVVPNSDAAVNAALTATAPAAGDNRTAASVATPLQQLLNVLAVVRKLFSGVTLGGLTDAFTHGGTVSAHNLSASNLVSCGGNYSGAGSVSCGGDVSCTNVNTSANVVASGNLSAVNGALTGSLSVGTIITANACSPAFLSVTDAGPTAMSCNGDATFAKAIVCYGAVNLLTGGATPSSLTSRNISTLTGQVTIQAVPGSPAQGSLKIDSGLSDVKFAGFWRPEVGQQTKIFRRINAISSAVTVSLLTTIDGDVVVINNTAAGDITVFATDTSVGAWITIKHKATSAHNLIVKDGSGGGATLATLAAGQSTTIYYDGTNWFTA